jgi:hypothetical protein
MTPVTDAPNIEELPTRVPDSAGDVPLIERDG